jgi:rubredoxin
MRYINPAKKVIGEGKRAWAKLEITLKCPRCTFRRKHKLARLQQADGYCPSCGTKLEKEKLFAKPGDAIQSVDSTTESPQP